MKGIQWIEKQQDREKRKHEDRRWRNRQTER